MPKKTPDSELKKAAADLLKKTEALKEQVLAAQYAALISKLGFKTPEKFNDWLRDLNHEERHCVRMSLAITRIFVRLANEKLTSMSDTTLLAFKNQDQLSGLLKMLRYEIIFKLRKDLATHQGELKAGRNELKGSPRNIKCDCLLN